MKKNGGGRGKGNSGKNQNETEPTPRKAAQKYNNPAPESGLAVSSPWGRKGYAKMKEKEGGCRKEKEKSEAGAGDELSGREKKGGAKEGCSKRREGKRRRKKEEL